MTARELLNQFNTLNESELDLPITAIYFCDDGFVHKQEIATVVLNPNADRIFFKLDPSTNRITFRPEPSTEMI